MKATVAELNQMDFGTHMAVMEEWNEHHDFDWQDATVILHGYYTRVVQTDGIGGLYIATYLSHGEGDLISLRVYTDTPRNLAENPAPCSEDWVKEAMVKDQKIGTEYWWHKDKGKFEAIHNEFNPE